MLQTPAIIFGFILIFVLVSGLVVLWRRGADDLDAWGLFISRVLRGDRHGGRRALPQGGDRCGSRARRHRRGARRAPARAATRPGAGLNRASTGQRR
jgi:hypothetical protein